jgi:hypothetical protein
MMTTVASGALKSPSPLRVFLALEVEFAAAETAVVALAVVAGNVARGLEAMGLEPRLDAAVGRPPALATRWHAAAAATIAPGAAGEGPADGI